MKGPKIGGGGGGGGSDIRFSAAPAHLQVDSCTGWQCESVCWLFCAQDNGFTENTPTVHCLCGWFDRVLWQGCVLEFVMRMCVIFPVLFLLADPFQFCWQVCCSVCYSIWAFSTCVSVSRPVCISTG